MINLKRVYDPISGDESYRILVERFWPRGLEKAKIDIWLKEIAPSPELCKWFSHDPAKWNEFKKRYHTELEEKRELVSEVKKIERERRKRSIWFIPRKMRSITPLRLFWNLSRRNKQYIEF